MLKRLTTELDKDLHDQFKSKVYSEGKDMTEVIIELIKNYIGEEVGK